MAADSGGGTPANKTKRPTASSSASGAKVESQTSFASAASSATSSSSATNVTPLDSAAALHLLLSPDGYYRYLAIPKPPPAHPGFLPTPATDDEEKKPLNADGSPASNGGEVDHDLVKKNYRRLSLRHHPDRRGGDADTFRVLNRAKRVLTNPKLRRQYDLLGLDLDDDDEDHHEEGKAETDEGGGAGGGAAKDGRDEDEKGGDKSGGGGSSSSSPDSVMSHLASATLASILQIAVRTAVMGMASTILCRYRLTVIPAVLFMIYVAYRVRLAKTKAPAGAVTSREMVAPLIIAAGMVLMYWGRDGEEVLWSWTFWLGEASVMTVLTMNSIPTKNPAALGGFAVGSVIISLILRGKFWRYAAVVAFEATLAFIAVLVFPIMEMILEEIMNEKLRKIGEQVRAHARRMDEYAAKKAAEPEEVD